MTEEATRPARGYSWAPFTAGNEVAVRHGAFSRRLIADRSVEVRADLLDRCPWIVDRVDDEALDRYARAEARARLLNEYIEAKVEVEGVEAVRPYLWTEAARSDANAQKFAQDLGLDPAGRSRIARDISLARRLFDPKDGRLAELGGQGRKLRQLRGRADAG